MVNQSARRATLHFVDIIETMSKHDPDLMIVFSNAAISAAAIVLQKRGLVDDAKDAFDSIFVDVVSEEIHALS